MLPHTPNPVTRANRRFHLEFALSMLAYVLVITLSRTLLHGPLRTASPTLQTLVAASPILPVALTFAATIRLILHTDELLRRIIIDSLALAGGATALLAITYGLIESDRFPHPSAWWTWITFGVAWLLSSFVLRRCYR